MVLKLKTHPKGVLFCFVFCKPTLFLHSVKWTSLLLNVSNIEHWLFIDTLKSGSYYPCFDTNSPLQQESRGMSPSTLHTAWWNTLWTPGPNTTQIHLSIATSMVRSIYRKLSWNSAYETITSERGNVLKLRWQPKVMGEELTHTCRIFSASVQMPLLSIFPYPSSSTVTPGIVPRLLSFKIMSELTNKQPYPEEWKSTKPSVWNCSHSHECILEPCFWGTNKECWNAVLCHGSLLATQCYTDLLTQSFLENSGAQLETINRQICFRQELSVVETAILSESLFLF